MKKKANKVSADHWPTQHLVLWRSTLDDVPLALIPDRRTAKRYAKNVSEHDARVAHDVMGLDFCSPVNVSVVTFRNGRPTKFEVVKDI